jgi:hypothetical protein
MNSKNVQRFEIIKLSKATQQNEVLKGFLSGRERLILGCFENLNIKKVFFPFSNNEIYTEDIKCFCIVFDFIEIKI